MIHPQAIVDPAAIVADDVSIGPFSVIGPEVEIGAGTVIGPHNVIKGPTKIGRCNRIFQFCSIGDDTPDMKYRGERTELEIGNNNIFREYFSVHRGTVQDHAKTSIGNDNLFLQYSHVAHDSVVGDHCIMSNAAAIAGHVHLGDWAIISATSAVHQYCHIGAHAFIGAYSAVYQDVPAYVTATGSPATPRVVNVEGLKRRGFEAEDIAAIKTAFKTLYKRKLSLVDALAAIREQMQEHPVVASFYESIADSKRNIVR